MNNTILVMLFMDQPVMLSNSLVIRTCCIVVFIVAALLYICGERSKADRVLRIIMAATLLIFIIYSINEVLS